MWILIDNYDSFTYILHHYLLSLHDEIMVIKNDEMTVEDIAQLAPLCIILSPGPKRPNDAGIIMEVIAHFIGRVPILGICLGHQALGEYLGAQLVKAPYPMHGKVSQIAFVDEEYINQFSPQTKVMRYHSLVLTNYKHIAGFRPLAYASDDQTLMMFAHDDRKCFGMQFHPESIGTELGMDLLKKWRKWAFK